MRELTPPEVAEIINRKRPPAPPAESPAPPEPPAESPKSAETQADLFLDSPDIIRTPKRKPGWKISGKWWTKDSACGLRYQCPECGKIALGTNFRDDDHHHVKRCPRRTVALAPAEPPAETPQPPALGEPPAANATFPEWFRTAMTAAVNADAAAAARAAALQKFLAKC